MEEIKAQKIEKFLLIPLSALTRRGSANIFNVFEE